MLYGLGGVALFIVLLYAVVFGWAFYERAKEWWRNRNPQPKGGTDEFWM